MPHSTELLEAMATADVYSKPQCVSVLFTSTHVLNMGESIYTRPAIILDNAIIHVYCLPPITIFIISLQNSSDAVINKIMRFIRGELAFIEIKDDPDFAPLVKASRDGSNPC